MENIFTLMNPLSSVIETFLTRINHVCTRQKIPFFIAGATAREILIHHVHGKSIGRRTRDIDIAIFVDEWKTFDALKQAFLAEGAKEISNNIHRMIWNETELDIIPFGGVAEQNQIAWPPDRNVIMAVDGFTEAFANTVKVALDNRESIPFCSLPGLSLLKLFAWRDRGHSNAKDAVDLYKIISEYGAIEDTRIYEPPLDGDKLSWDPVRMGAVLLGYDIALMSQVDSKTVLSALDKEKLTDDIVRQLSPEQSEAIEQIIDDFWTGIFYGS
ncbi:nucleotidyl transferase AbiEii/AbiGii toxin family protein [Xenorhabdus bovienii]|uniref:nucleotidyl transferase AbiEii/AbiGii toxin family protein n=1 Tax=Xenorhabdus bovienii TaxID=40576 RepID=UPI0023B350A2|nr:nucleotidyl transferase AbiEii/AbiGii toxin family protein [Xenorhabdus bovienii]MDE9541635.1 nucleotidyl transferase AbiEii/AbiGii toxin family protein [Xenorhabdus bovienii]